MKRLIWAALLLALPGFAQQKAQPAQQKTQTERQMEEMGLVRIQDVDPTIKVSLAFTRPDNVTGSVLYTDIHHAYLVPQAARALKRAQAYLKRIRPDLSLKVYDAARPMTLQWKLYRAVAGKKENIYISSPQGGGDQHNYGLAVDVTLCRADNGDTLAMGTRIGDLVQQSRVSTESYNSENGGLTKEEFDNRELLRKVMAVAGFKALRTEWWHFNFRTRSEAKANFRMVK